MGFDTQNISYDDHEGLNVKTSSASSVELITIKHVKL